MSLRDQSDAEMVARPSGLIAPALPSAIERVAELEVKLARARDLVKVLLVTYPSGYNNDLRRLAGEIIRETKPR
jgi:hypothetical protein